ncbi:hypothetical protein VKX94_02105 [Lactobacillus helveticus]|uniref:Transposase n=1 Tax=Lactobacillus helveticus CIRM-BIA 951 TaxID=1226334 RepID=U6F5R1_LACHE|nr:hypothetical protein [Lactobacillus helveticus]MDY0990917.1 hypothetical protein [Lactobacillus helveticus]MDY1001584.1 hypothetical protein [Lactobacillus helveticus]MEB2873438.1 hypothetical protein [Lactobacillus helveticus]CDI58583.1 Protein of unknown function [Lactobacillus helveticus CIRM-BIA 951]
MKRRIRKKKIKQEIAYIDFLISRNKQKSKEHTKDISLKCLAIRFASVLSILGLSFHKAILIKQLKRGNY